MDNDRRTKGMPWRTVITLSFLFLFPLSNQEFTMITVDEKEFFAEVAFTETEKKKGLSGRDSIPEGFGILFVYDKPDYMVFQTKTMLFPIDIIFLKEGKVLEVFENVPPGNIIHSSHKADMVLETNPKEGIEKGDVLNFF